MSRPRVLVLILFLLFWGGGAAIAGPASADALGDEYIGEWESNDLDALPEWGNGDCGAVATTTRKYVIQRRPNSGAIMITYVNQTWGHYFRNVGAKCVFPGQTEPTFAFARLRTWQGEPRLDRDGSLIFDAKYFRCDMMACTADPMMFTGNFQTRLTVTDGHLIDPGDGVNVTWKTRYWSATALVGAKREARETVDSIVAHLAKDAPEAFISNYLMHPPPGIEPLGSIRELRRLSRHVVSRESMDLRLIDQIALVRGYGPTKMIFSYATVKLDTGVPAVETVLLINEQGVWKLFGYHLFW